MTVPPVTVSDITSGFDAIRPGETVRIPAQDRSALYRVMGETPAIFWTSREKSFTVEKGEAICFPMGVEHWITTTKTLGVAQRHLQPPFQSQKSPDWAPDSAHLFCSRIPTASNPMPDIIPSVIHIESDDMANETRLDLVMDLFIHHVERPSQTSERILRRLAEVIAIIIMESVLKEFEQRGVNTIDGVGDPALRRAINAMHLAPEKNWTLGDLADEAALSRTVFAERFKEGLGQPPMKYLTRLRLSQGRRLLTDSDRSVPDIAFAVGYNSEGAFRKAFKRLFEESPSEYRERARSR